MSVSTRPDVQAIHDGILPLWAPGGVHELRVLHANGRQNNTVSGYFDDPAKLALAAATWSGKAPGVYMTLNPVKPELFARGANRAAEWSRTTTSDADIAHRRWLPLDCDPVRPAGISSTEAQHTAALDRAVQVARWLTGLGFPRESIILADSGNGAHVMVHLELPNRPEATELVRRAMEAVSLRHSDAVIGVDLKMYNAARIWKCYGTRVCKGDDLPDYPHRVARVLRAPDDLAPADHALLERLASFAPAQTAYQPRGATAFDIRDFITEHLAHDVAFEREWQGGTKWVLQTCPFNPDHNDRSAVLIEQASGALGFTCHHNGCAGKRWRDVRELFEPAHLRGTVAAPAAQEVAKNGHHPPDEPPPTRSSPTGIAPTRGFNLTDIGNGERFHAQHGNDVLFVEKWGRDGKWLTWDGTRFANDDTLEIMRRGVLTVRSIYAEADAEPEGPTREAIGKHAIRSEASSKLASMVKEARKQCATTPEVFDTDPWLFNCANGTLDLRTGELYPHRRLDRLIKRSEIAYDPHAECPTWLQALDRWMAGHQALVDFVQRALGYCLTGVTTEDCFFFAYGPGRNGKSVCMRVAEHVYGEYAQPTRPETITAQPRGDASNDIAALRAARFVPTIEVEEGARLAEGLVKQLTGGDRVSVRFLYGEFFAFTPMFKLWLVANHKPVIKGTDPAIWTRVRLIPFTVTIPEAERDPRLTEKLRAEAPGILRWMLRGCLDWQHRGLDPPEEVLLATEEYREEMDTLSQFLEDCCRVDTDLMVFASSLYDTYTTWCSANGERAWSRVRFGRSLSGRGFKQDRMPGGNRTRLWSGLDVRADAPTHTPTRDA